jgi:predicted nucleic acid-binding protein
MPIKDGLIAATALAHDWTIATRNPRGYANSQMPSVNPFEV